MTKQRPLPRSMWFRWASPMLWNGVPRNHPMPTPDMTDEEKDLLKAALIMDGFDPEDIPNG